MTNGCICCTLREDLLREVMALAKERVFDYLVIESTGVGEPMQVAETFTFDDDSGETLMDHARLDTCVTVIDAGSFMRDFFTPDELADRYDDAAEEDERNVVDLLTDQVRFCERRRTDQPLTRGMGGRLSLRTQSCSTRRILCRSASLVKLWAS